MLFRSVVYGSLTTAIVVLLSFEIAATLLLVGAQVIAEYERIGVDAPPGPNVLRTEAVPSPLAVAPKARPAMGHRRRKKNSGSFSR